MPTQSLQPTLRFAPSPTGELHIGHALSALINQQFAHNLGGRLLLRIEDIDTGRRRQAFVDGIFRDLEWLGFEWEEPVLQQSDRFEIYRSYLNRLDQAGLLYPCFATRKEIAEAAQAHGSGFDPEGSPVYPGIHKDLTLAEVARRKSSSEAFALRLNMDLALKYLNDRRSAPPLRYQSVDHQGRLTRRDVDPALWGDVILARKDNGTSYHMACTIDDALQGVTHVVRGQDLEGATDIHRLLQELLGLPEPLYHHHDLIVETDGRKLSKSFGDISLRQLREAGLRPDDIVAKLQSFLLRYN